MNQPLHARWLVITGILIILSILATYQFLPPTVENQPKQYIPVAPVLPTVNAQVNQYLIDHYGSLDRNARIVRYYAPENCLGVDCELWGIQPSAEQLTIFVRCYVDTGNCLPTYENFIVQPNAGNFPTVTPFGSDE